MTATGDGYKIIAFAECNERGRKISKNQNHKVIIKIFVTTKCCSLFCEISFCAYSEISIIPIAPINNLYESKDI